MTTNSNVAVTTVSVNSKTKSFWEIDDYARDVFIVVYTCIIVETINFFGILSNIINIIVFVKQGFRETINISLFGLAISDLGCLVTLQWMNLCYNPLFRNIQLPFLPLEIQYITAGWPHACFARITGLITAYITLERCLCIVIPLKVKTVMTPRRTVLAIAGIFILMFASTAPITAVNLWQWKFDPSQNRTLLGIARAENWVKVEQITFALNNTYGYLAFLSVTGLTSVLVRRLQSKSKWRQASTAVSQTLSASTRDRKVVKMVVMISTFFIVCFFPTTVVFLGNMVTPDFGIDGRYQNIYHVLCQFAFGLETINSSVNILIYLGMSSRFKQVFQDTFCLCLPVREK